MSDSFDAAPAPAAVARTSESPALPDPGGPVPKVAIAVVSWNTAGLLGEALGSMRADVEAERAAVWVVDNGSSDGSPELVEARFPWVHVIRAPANLGFGRAVNLVAARTTTPWIAAANADIRLEPNALRELLRAGTADATAAVIAPRLQLADGSTQHSVHPFPSLVTSATIALGVDRYWPTLGDRLCLHGTWDPDVARRVPWAMGAFLLVRRSAWEEVGGFDDRLWMYAEDLDLGWRLHRAGWRTRYEPRAVAFHHGAASTRQTPWGAASKTAQRKARSEYAWIMRRRGTWMTRMIAGVRVLGAGARWARAGLLVTLGRSEWESERRRWRGWVRLHCIGLRALSAPVPTSTRVSDPGAR